MKIPAHMRYERGDLLARYERCVIRRGDYECWGWNGPRHEHGYGVICSVRGNIGAHRASYFLFNGDLTPGKEVLHICHTPECTNPRHLAQGTRKQNMHTSRVAGRMQRRIPLEALPAIESRRNAGATLSEIAKDYNCTKQAVRHMIRTAGLDETGARKKDKPTLITYQGTTLPLVEWAARMGMPRDTLRNRFVRQGWTAERSLTEPVGASAGKRGPSRKT